jgi:hypothetical protein
MQFSNANRFYDIRFNLLNLIQIVGEAATGKSLMCADLREVCRHDEWYKKHLYVIDVSNRQAMGYFDSCMRDYEYIVIDNADVLLTLELQLKICDSLFSDDKKTNNKWILIGRKLYVCAPINCVGVLAHKTADGNQYYSIDYTQKF